MAPVASLVASALLLTTLVIAAPLNDVTALANKQPTTVTDGVPSDGRKLRKARALRLENSARKKREVTVEEEPDEESLEQQLADLSDDQLALLANIVQEELNEYDPNLPPETYQTVELPEEMFFNQLDDGGDGVYEDAIALPRDRRSVIVEEPSVIIPEEDLEQLLEEEEQSQEPEIILIPEEMPEKTDDAESRVDELVNELELRSRIAELADILNQRASRVL